MTKYRKKSDEGTWRSANQLRGIRSRLTSAIKACNDGATVHLDIRTAENLQKVCDQAIRTEVNHERTPET